MEIDFNVCCCCNGPADGGVLESDDGNHNKDIPVCSDCWQTERIHRWVDSAKREIEDFASKVGVMSDDYTGNILKDLVMVRAYWKHEANIQDGVCPNGCARMRTVEPGHYECPVCSFVLYQKAL